MVSLNIPPHFPVTDKQFQILSLANRELRLEKNSRKELIIMPPTGGNTGRRNLELCFQLQAWNRQTNLGIAFDSSTGFRLPNGAYRSPDLSWVKMDRWNQLTLEQQDSFPPICPDFVIELRSRSDNLENLKDKMQEYLDNGTCLGWLIDPQQKIIIIYRRERVPEILSSPQTLSGENILPGFKLDLGLIY